MRFRSVARDTVAASAVIAAFVLGAATVAGHLSVGVGLSAGLVIGSLNGQLVTVLLARETPFVAGSVVRMALVTAAAVLVAILLGSPAWAVLLGVGAAQLVMAGAGIRRGLHA